MQKLIVTGATATTTASVPNTMASAQPAPAPVPPPAEVKQEPPAAVAPPAVPAPVQVDPPTPVAPAAAPNPAPAQTTGTNSDSSIPPIMRDVEEPKMATKVEPRNGLDKVETSQYIDPIERSLASLERSLQADVPMDVSVSVSESSMRLEDEFAMPKQQMLPDAEHHSLMAQLGGLTEMTHVPDQIKNEIYMPPHNGFIEKNIHHEREILRHDVNPNLSGMTGVPPVSSIFDPMPLAPQSVIAQSHHNMPNTPCLMTPAVKKEDVKPLLTPKPIEDLMGVPNMVTNNSMSDRAKYEMEQKKIEDSKNSSFVQAFKLKQEQNLKNASSWSSLAQAGSPQSIPNISTNNQIKQKPVMDSFQVSIAVSGLIIYNFYSMSVTS